MQTFLSKVFADDLDRLLSRARFSFCISVDLREFDDGDEDAADNDDSVVMAEKEKVRSLIKFGKCQRDLEL